MKVVELNWVILWGSNLCYTLKIQRRLLKVMASNKLGYGREMKMSRVWGLFLNFGVDIEQHSSHSPFFFPSVAEMQVAFPVPSLLLFLFLLPVLFWLPCFIWTKVLHFPAFLAARDGCSCHSHCHCFSSTRCCLSVESWLSHTWAFTIFQKFCLSNQKIICINE